MAKILGPTWFSSFSALKLRKILPFNSGHLLENLVFIELRRRYQHIYYYRTKDDLGIDFVTLDETSKAKHLYQVTESIQSSKTAAQEIKALKETMSELGCSEEVIVTRYEQEEITVNSGVIHVMPAWKFLIKS